ncbi:MAG: hypothetical protein ACOX0E_10045 [Syntrophomonadaceae bacterium]|jgi:hypothetical protein
MAVQKEFHKRIYDETAALIGNLGIKGQITPKETEFLYFVLKEVFYGSNNPGLLECLKGWLESDPLPDIDEIIKATALAIDFNDPESIEKNTRIIKDLLVEKRLCQGG